jgi:hypothetical protein
LGLELKTLRPAAWVHLIKALLGEVRPILVPFQHFERKITERWIGPIVRRKLRLRTQKVQGVYVVPPTEEPLLKLMFNRYGISAIDGEAKEVGDIGDVAQGEHR